VTSRAGRGRSRTAHLHSWERPWRRMLPSGPVPGRPARGWCACRPRRHWPGTALTGRSAAGTCCCRTPAVWRSRPCAARSAASPSTRPQGCR